MTPRQHQEVARLARAICELVLLDGYQADDLDRTSGDEVCMIQGSREFHRLCKLLGVEIDMTPGEKPKMYWEDE